MRMCERLMSFAVREDECMRQGKLRLDYFWREVLRTTFATRDVMVEQGERKTKK